MKNSRNEGILVLNTKRPYKMANPEGELEERTEIICRDVNSKVENSAFDLEQKLMSAMSNLPERATGSVNKKQIKIDQQKENDFFSSDSPTEKQVEEQAQALEMAVKFNTVVKISEIIDIFIDFINAGCVQTAGQHKMTKPIWESLSRHDKSRIVFMYCAFFVNPLEQLRNMEL